MSNRLKIVKKCIVTGCEARVSFTFLGVISETETVVITDMAKRKVRACGGHTQMVMAKLADVPGSPGRIRAVPITEGMIKINPPAEAGPDSKEINIDGE